MKIIKSGRKIRLRWEDIGVVQRRFGRVFTRTFCRMLAFNQTQTPTLTDTPTLTHTPPPTHTPTPARTKMLTHTPARVLSGIPTRHHAPAMAVAMLLFALGVAPGQAGAQAYPAKPVRMIQSLGAGGGSDPLARLVAQKLSEALGQIGRAHV